MKRLIVSLLVLGLFSNIYAATAQPVKKVITCTSYMIGANAELDCGGDYYGDKTSMVKLYKEGWRFVGDIGGVSNKFMLVFEK